jgi:hypothetical protein
MSEKKTLYKIKGNSSNTMENRMIRTHLSTPELNQHDKRFSPVTWKEKPKGFWPGETEDIEIYGVKK